MWSDPFNQVHALKYHLVLCSDVHRFKFRSITMSSLGIHVRSPHDHSGTVDSPIFSIPGNTWNRIHTDKTWQVHWNSFSIIRLRHNAKIYLAINTSNVSMPWPRSLKALTFPNYLQLLLKKQVEIQASIKCICMHLSYISGNRGKLKNGFGSSAYANTHAK